MTASIVPTIDTPDLEEYRQQIARVADFAVRLHIDAADGVMTPMELVPIADIWWPGGVRADIHVMYKRPMEHLPALIALGPQLVIMHAEAEGDFEAASATLRAHGIEAGVALMPETPVDYIAPGLNWIDHVLIYSGSLGTFGGNADLSLLAKARQLKNLKPTLELGWDGGVNDRNAAELMRGGIDVLNTGGFIHKSHDPQAAYATLERVIAGK
jgi:ribulose-phosphate 3-epimerase